MIPETGKMSLGFHLDMNGRNMFGRIIGGLAEGADLWAEIGVRRRHDRVAASAAAGWGMAELSPQGRAAGRRPGCGRGWGIRAPRWVVHDGVVEAAIWSYFAYEEDPLCHFADRWSYTANPTYLIIR
jgi:hypothetical protein